MKWYLSVQPTSSFPHRPGRQQNRTTARDLGYVIDFNDDGGLPNPLPQTSTRREPVAGLRDGALDFEDGTEMIDEARQVGLEKILGRLDAMCALPIDVLKLNTDLVKGLNTRFPSPTVLIGYPRVVFSASAEDEDDEDNAEISSRTIQRADVNGASALCEGC